MRQKHGASLLAAPSLTADSLCSGEANASDRVDWPQLTAGRRVTLAYGHYPKATGG